MTSTQAQAPRTAKEFFAWARLQETDDCILWPFSASGKGYPMVRSRGRWALAHREVCILEHGEPPTPDHETAHSCGNRPCINKRHVSWKLHADNEIDKRQHGTDLNGEKHPMVKLTADQVREIRAIGKSRSQTEIARQYGVSQTHVSSILRGEKWATL